MGQKVGSDRLDKCNLHTILRLPTGIFYAQGVKTNVLFFTRGTKDKDGTEAVWFYDMRTNAPSFGERTPLTRANLADFEKATSKTRSAAASGFTRGRRGDGGGSRARSSASAGMI